MTFEYLPLGNFQFRVLFCWGAMRIVNTYLIEHSILTMSSAQVVAIAILIALLAGRIFRNKKSSHQGVPLATSETVTVLASAEIIENHLHREGVGEIHISSRGVEIVQ